MKNVVIVLAFIGLLCFTWSCNPAIPVKEPTEEISGKDYMISGLYTVVHVNISRAADDGVGIRIECMDSSAHKIEFSKGCTLEDIETVLSFTISNTNTNSDEAYYERNTFDDGSPISYRSLIEGDFHITIYDADGLKINQGDIGGNYNNDYITFHSNHCASNIGGIDTSQKTNIWFEEKAYGKVVSGLHLCDFKTNYERADSTILCEIYFGSSDSPDSVLLDSLFYRIYPGHYGFRSVFNQKDLGLNEDFHTLKYMNGHLKLKDKDGNTVTNIDIGVNN